MAGCVRVDTDFHFTSPGRVVVEQQLQGTTASRQKPLLLGLQGLAPWLQEQVSGASELMAEELPQPQLKWRERNWLVGAATDPARLGPQARACAWPEPHLHWHPFSAAAVRQVEPPSRPNRLSNSIGSLNPVRSTTCCCVAGVEWLGPWQRCGGAAADHQPAAAAVPSWPAGLKLQGSGSIARCTPRGSSLRSSASAGSGKAESAGPCSSNCQRLRPATLERGRGWSDHQPTSGLVEARWLQRWWWRCWP